MRMKLLDKPLTKAEKDNILRMLDGCICRVCVSGDPEEIVRMVCFANDYIGMLACSRMKQLEDRQYVSNSKKE